MGRMGGKRRGAGRPKGSMNKWTAAIKDAIIGAFERAGGEAYLIQVAKKDPRTFCGLLGRVLPTTLEGGFEVTQRVDVARLPTWALSELERGVDPAVVLDRVKRGEVPMLPVSRNDSHYEQEAAS